LFILSILILSACSKSTQDIIGVWERNGVKIKVERGEGRNAYDGLTTQKDENGYINRVWDIYFYSDNATQGNMFDNAYDDTGGVVYAFQIKNDELFIYNETKIPYKYDKKDILEIWKKVD
jgi:hypothetical protein